MSQHRIAFVIQRYGLEVNGGAELECRWVAEHLSRYLPVDVLTTCAIEYERWTNEYPAGPSELNGVRVLRFLVDRPRDPRRFQSLTAKVLGGPHTAEDELAWMQEQGPISSGLLEFLSANAHHYDAVIFFTYLYATTYYGIQRAPERALLVPTAHDEPPIYLNLFRSIFTTPRFIIYNTEAERRFVQRRFQNHDVPSTVVGTGIDIPSEVNGERFRAKHGIHGDFVIYVGRVDQSKNIHVLCDYFRTFRPSYMGDLKLVVVGKGAWPLPHHPDIVPLGFISEQDKFDAIQAASVLIVPSQYESLSMALLDAWAVGTPVLVNGNCEVLKEQCRLSNGGLWYQSQIEFDWMLRTLLAYPDLRCRLASAGQTFAKQMYAWEHVEQRYLQILDQLAAVDHAKKSEPPHAGAGIDAN
jgi:glycosyltransferase involved in cell wall biosynthesis